MSDVNLLLLSGNVGSDPDVRTAASGKLWASFSFATTVRFNGEEKTEWTRCVAFGKNAETISEHVKKGTKLMITGEKSTSQYVDKSGNNRDDVRCMVHRFHFLGPKQQGNATGQPAQNNKVPEKDDIPF